MPASDRLSHTLSLLNSWHPAAPAITNSHYIKVHVSSKTAIADRMVHSDLTYSVSKKRTVASVFAHILETHPKPYSEVTVTELVDMTQRPKITYQGELARQMLKLKLQPR